MPKSTIAGAISAITLLMITMVASPVLLMQAADVLAAPSISDPNLKIEVVAEGLVQPTTMTFLGPDDILVLKKTDGTVRRILNGAMLSDPVLNVKVAHKYERGMLGIDVLLKKQEQQGNGSIDNTSSTNRTYVFLYYTEIETETSDICPRSGYCVPGNGTLRNHVYRYDWENSTNTLVNPVLLTELPADPGPIHNGGKLVVGPDNNVYFTIGDLLSHRSATQNFPNTTAYNGSSGIYRITQDGKPVQAILGDIDPLDKYYAYGIRNSFGMDFDPVTGKLWDTENGPDTDDEINLVEPGFNSGWAKVQGIWDINGDGTTSEIRPNSTILEDFEGKGKYSNPEFVWNITTGPTALKFLNSEKLGKQYKNDMFVGGFNQGYIYHFELDQNRTGLSLGGPLTDKIANSVEELEGVIFGEGFDLVTDIQVGPDGYLYIVSYGDGKIYRILPATL